MVLGTWFVAKRALTDTLFRENCACLKFAVLLVQPVPFAEATTNVMIRIVSANWVSVLVSRHTSNMGAPALKKLLWDTHAVTMNQNILTASKASVRHQTAGVSTKSANASTIMKKMGTIAEKEVLVAKVRVAAQQ